MPIEAHCVPSEKDLAADLEMRLSLLNAEQRYSWRSEVRLLCFTHAAKSRSPQTLRIDYVAKIDGILVGFEVKKPPETPADLGRYLWQCAQYAQGVIGAATVDRVPAEWIGQALLAVFLVSDARHSSQNVKTHGQAAHRLFGPANVGFFRRECRHPDCFELFLCADRAWSREWGWHRGLVHKSARIGNSSAKVAEVSEVTVPDEWAHTHPFKS